MNKIKNYLDLSVYESNLLKLEKLKLEYNTLCQLLNENVKEKLLYPYKTDELKMQIDLNDDFVSVDSNIQLTSTPRYKNEEAKFYENNKNLIEKCVIVNENSTQTETLLKKDVNTQIDESTDINVEQKPKAYRSIDSGIGGVLEISEIQSGPSSLSQSFYKVFENDDENITENDEDEAEMIIEQEEVISKQQNIVRKRLDFSDLNKNKSSISESVESPMISVVEVSSENVKSKMDGNVKTTFLKKLLLFMFCFLFICFILIYSIYPLFQPSCGNIIKKDYFYKYIFMDEENLNNAPTAF